MLGCEAPPSCVLTMLECKGPAAVYEAPDRLTAWLTLLMGSFASSCLC